MKKVVLCVPIYNAAQTLRETLDSLLNQSHPAFRIKLFDNASTDSTPDIIEEYRSRFPAIEVHRNSTLVSAEDNFTNCIRSAEGDFTAIVHSDDMYEPDYIESTLKVFESKPECAAVFTHALEIDLSGKVLGERPMPAFLKHEEVTIMGHDDFLARVLEYSNFLTCPSAMVRSNIYSDVVKTWNGKDYRTSADLDTWLRIARVGSIGFIKRPLVRYRVATTSLSYRMAKVRTARHDLFLVLDKYVKEKELSRRSLDDYRFLNFKDDAFRTLNALKNRIALSMAEPHLPVEWPLVFERLFRSRWHFKMSIGIIIAHLLRSFGRLA